MDISDKIGLLRKAPYVAYGVMALLIILYFVGLLYAGDAMLLGLFCGLAGISLSLKSQIEDLRNDLNHVEIRK